MREAVAVTTSITTLITRWRRDSIPLQGELRRRRRFVGPSERRRMKSARARERARRAAARPRYFVDP